MAKLFGQSILHGTLLVKTQALWRFPNFEYVEGTEKGGEYVEHWDLYQSVTIPKSPLDRYHTVKDNELGRLDLLSYRYYGTTRMMQIIAIANNLIVINDEMFAGMVLRMPDMGSVTKAIQSARQKKARLAKGLSGNPRSTGT